MQLFLYYWLAHCTNLLFRATSLVSYYHTWCLRRNTNRMDGRRCERAALAMGRLMLTPPLGYINEACFCVLPSERAPSNLVTGCSVWMESGFSEPRMRKPWVFLNSVDKKQHCWLNMTSQWWVCRSPDAVLARLWVMSLSVPDKPLWIKNELFCPLTADRIPSILYHYSVGFRKRWVVLFSNLEFLCQ